MVASPGFCRGEPIFRALLVQFGADDHAIVIATHHIALDLPHTQNFFTELLAVYDAFRSGRPSPLPDLSVQYADYARWRRETGQGPEFEAHRDYWRRQMVGATPLKLPFSRSPPAQRTAETHAVALPLDGSVFDNFEISPASSR